jgi:hypothetical protein
MDAFNRADAIWNNLLGALEEEDYEEADVVLKSLTAEALKTLSVYCYTILGNDLIHGMRVESDWIANALLINHNQDEIRSSFLGMIHIEQEMQMRKSKSDKLLQDTGLGDPPEAAAGLGGVN